MIIDNTKFKNQCTTVTKKILYHTLIFIAKIYLFFFRYNILHSKAVKKIKKYKYFKTYCDPLLVTIVELILIDWPFVEI